VDDAAPTDRGQRVIRIERATFTYDDGTAPVLRDVDLTVEEGALCVVVGRTGSGKSTLLGLVNGLVPHFTGGHLSGRVTVDGRDTRTHHPRDLADVVGYVGQDPSLGFVTDTVEEELAYGLEQLALPALTMRKRVEETLDLLGIADLRGRALSTLSGGQQQRVAIGSVLAAHPRTLLLDEPTSALDPTAAEEVLATLTRLVHDLGVTVLVAEHRLERVAHFADMIALVDGGMVEVGDPAAILAGAAIAPPVVHLARLAGWSPVPLSVRDARRHAAPLRAALAGRRPPRPPIDPIAPTALTARGLRVRYGDVVAVRDVDLELRAGDVVALMGRNGSGKSSLLWALQGSGPRERGRVAAEGVGLVPQTPSDLLYLPTVADECAQADLDAGQPPGACRAVLARIAGEVDDRVHPRDLSEGQRLCLVVAIQLAANPPVLLLDEPTRGLDPVAKLRFSGVIEELANDGHAIVIATHDVELVAAIAARVVVLAAGEIVADGPTADVICASPAFAPQVAKILQPEPWLTVDDVATALAAAP
jgi:energy-coupling factor transporter ATP-binding protein EcfA2